MNQSSEPYTVRLDAETAREMAVKGATILLLDIPEGTVVGIDQQVRIQCPPPPFNSLILTQFI